MIKETISVGARVARAAQATIAGAACSGLMWLSSGLPGLLPAHI